jgi:hypothetical protein
MCVAYDTPLSVDCGTVLDLVKDNIGHRVEMNNGYYAIQVQ